MTVFREEDLVLRISKLARAAAGAVLTLTAISCAGPEDTEQETVQSNLFVQTGKVLWNGASVSNQAALGTAAAIPVCFAVRPRIDSKKTTQCPLQSSQNVDCQGWATTSRTAPFPNQTFNSAAFRQNIRSVISKTWVHSANIDFYNWGDCPIDAATGKHDDAQLTKTIVIQFQQEWDPPPNQKCTSDANCSGTPNGAVCGSDKICHAGGVNWSGLGMSSTAPTVIQYNWPAIALGIEDHNITHEFGHALGFTHEFARSDYPKTCAGDIGQSAFGTEPIANSIALTSFPDTASVMNYCSSGLLSPGDVLGAQRAYGRKGTGSLVSSDGWCADISNASSTAGASVLTYPCYSRSNDLWFRDSGSQRLQANLSSSIQRCLNVKGGTVSGGGPTPVVSWTCDSGTNEQFSFTGVQWRGMGNMCATAVGSSVQMKSCDNSLATQKWTFLDGDPNTSLRYDQIRSDSTGLCVSTSTGTLGEQVTLKTCSATDTKQRFAFSGQGVIGFGNLCLNVLGGLPNEGSAIGLWDGCTTTPRQINGQFSVSGPVTSLGQCLDSSNTSQVSVSPCSSGSASQTWEYYF